MWQFEVGGWQGGISERGGVRKRRVCCLKGLQFLLYKNPFLVLQTKIFTLIFHPIDWGQFNAIFSKSLCVAMQTNSSQDVKRSIKETTKGTIYWCSTMWCKWCVDGLSAWKWSKDFHWIGFLETLVSGGVETSGQRAYCKYWKTRRLIFEDLIFFWGGEGFDSCFGYGSLKTILLCIVRELAWGGSDAVAVGLSESWLVTRNTWHVTHDT